MQIILTGNEARQNALYDELFRRIQQESTFPRHANTSRQEHDAADGSYVIELSACPQSVMDWIEATAGIEVVES